MEIIFLIIGAIGGGLIVWLILQKKSAGIIAKLQTEKSGLEEKLSESRTEQSQQITALNALRDEKESLSAELVQLTANHNSQGKELQKAEEKLESTETKLEAKTVEYNKLHNTFSTVKADYKALEDKLSTQKEEMAAMAKKFNTDFENIANKILEEKSEKFTKSNKENISAILKPLNEDIEKFKTKVNEVYIKNSNERSTLMHEVKRLSELNHTMTEETKNLTSALKGESKTQGGWGEMILEKILEMSGLRKNEGYFMEHQLSDENDKPILSESEGKKMRPDAVIKYPGDRHVIIDSKVSLNAFTRYLNADDPDEQKRELASHVSAVKNHIIGLSNKGYDDYNKALDFVMMFIPSEPAYIAAIQGDPNLWQFAYDKRIMLLNPTNLIISLKLIVDLWRREKQALNAAEIAKRGGKMYDKFVGFIANMEGIKDYLDKANKKYDSAYGQLHTGNDSLVTQATKLKDLGIKNKHELSKQLESEASLTQAE